MSITDNVKHKYRSKIVMATCESPQINLIKREALS